MTTHGKNVFLGFGAGVAVTTLAAILMGQGAAQPASTPRAQDHAQYFVTGDSNSASLWMRDGSSLRWVGRGDTSAPPIQSEPTRQREPGSTPNPK